MPHPLNPSKSHCPEIWMVRSQYSLTLIWALILMKFSQDLCSPCSCGIKFCALNLFYNCMELWNLPVMVLHCEWCLSSGYLQSLDTYFTHNEDRDNKTFGDTQVQWTTQGREKALLKQYNLVWYSHDDRVVQTKYVSTDYDKCSIPVTRLK